MQTGADLVSAGLPTAFPWTALLGGYTNAAQANLPVRSNAEWLGITNASSTALVATGVAAIVPVPVVPGVQVTNVSVITTASASSPTHAWAALYQGTGSAPALIAQTTDAGSAAIGTSAFFSFSFSSAQSLTATQVPFGYVYAAISVTASTVCNVMTVAAPASGVNTAWNAMAGGSGKIANLPLWVSLTAGSSLGATAASTIASGSAATTAPLVFLS